MNDDGGLGEHDTLDGGDAMGSAPTERSAGDLVLEAQRAKVLGALFTTPVLRRFGHYVVLGVLGQGGMGVVLKGYDDELDRQVAIKVLRRELDERHTARLRREAQAMAKLSHPNVVQVYEVGQLEGRTFVVMELVKGQTVWQWLTQEPRPGWRACVEVFLQLGQGLAAAHRRGLVHRDFKPGNAIIDEEGRARVLDFGLVRRDEDVDEEASVRIQKACTGAHAEVLLETALTKAGAVVGTPAYMPAEQMEGRPADARSDQFSFCVALFEAVYGERPYEGSSMMALLMSMRTGTVRPAPRGSDVPLALRKVLLRGLAVEPAERWPSMEALLEALRRIASPRRFRVAVIGVTVGLVAVGGGLSTTQALEWLNRCTGAREQLEGAWDDARRQEVRAAILATGLSYAPGTWGWVEPKLDAYADAWATEHTEACEATRSRNEQSEEEMSLRMGCLHERWQHLRATVDELRQADATVVAHAVEAVTSLPKLERCRDLGALRAEVPPPEDPEVARKVAALEELLVEAKAKQDAGKYEDGQRLVDEVVARGGALEHEPLMARAWLRQGSLLGQRGMHERAVEVLRKAYGAALAHTMKAEAANASTELMYVLSFSLARLDEARGWAENAEPLSRAAGTTEARAWYLNNLGVLAALQGEHDEARGYFEQALVIKEKGLGPDHPDVAVSLSNLGRVADLRGKHDEARALHERALTIWEHGLGPEHPNVAVALGNLGEVALAQGEHEQARALHERALAIWERALGPGHSNVAISLGYLGAVALAQGEHEEARELHERALAIREEVLGPEHPNVAYSLTGLGEALLGLAEPDEALVPLERALIIRTTHEVPPALLAETRFALARALWAAPVDQGGDLPRARALAEQALDAYATLGDAKRSALAEVQAWLDEHGVP